MNKNEIEAKKVLFELYKKLVSEDFVKDTVEITNCSMELDANIDSINIGEGFKTNEQYIQKEIQWYTSQQLDATEIGKIAKIWNMVCDENNKVNSNYGFLIYSAQNGNQYENVLKELQRDKLSRRAVAYYTNPWMHHQGHKDHVCTLAVSYYIRDEKLNCSVIMRSNDFKFGFLNDYGWQRHVLISLAEKLNVGIGHIHWFSVSMHLYSRHFKLLENLFKEEDVGTGKNV